MLGHYITEKKDKRFGKTETPPAAVLLGEERETSKISCLLFCRARITGTPHGIGE
jgi:hypothetical protein